MLNSDGAIIAKVMAAGELMREAVEMALAERPAATMDEALQLSQGFALSVSTYAAIAAYRGVEGSGPGLAGAWPGHL